MYDQPRVQITHDLGSHDFGAGALATSIKGPKHMRPIIRDIIVTATETFTQDTTPAYVRVGTTGDNDAYAEANLGVTADTDTFVASQDDTDAIKDVQIPKDTQLEVNLVAPTGGTPAGIGRVAIVVDWT